MISKIKYTNSRKIYAILLLLILLFFIYILPATFAASQPVKSIEIFSEKLNYKEKEPGSWKITKSAKWTGKGEAEISFDVESIQKLNYESTDTIFVLDISDSMNGEKLDKVKADTTDLINNLLINNNNKIALITFETESSIVQNFTNDKQKLLNAVNNLTTGHMTNYYQALKNVEAILKKYNREDNRKCVILFLTDGYPNEDTPNELAQYTYLKQTFPYITINAIQYEMGKEILTPIKIISDYQYIADMKTLNNALFEAHNVGEKYNKFVITDLINSENFYLEGENDISIDKGHLSFNKEKQEIVWNIDDYDSGKKAHMSINVKLKSKVESGFYPTNKKEILESELDEIQEKTEINDTPILSDKYVVKYSANAPDTCMPTLVPSEKEHYVFDTVEISEVFPKCDGYQFKGWKIDTNGITQINSDYFVMPEKEVTLKGTWGKVNIKKGMDGTIEEGLTLYKQIQADSNVSSKNVKKYTGDTSTFKGNKEVYYYYGAATNNNVLFANYCWKIVRTTDTGGVKLLYNGLPTSGRCNNTGINTMLKSTQMNRSSNYVPFNDLTPSSAADVGYMYNIRYPLKNFVLSGNNYKFGNSFVYEDGKYTLNNAQNMTSFTLDYKILDDNKYSCFNETGTCSTIYFINSYFRQQSRVYYIEISNGNGIEDALDEMLYSNVNFNNSTIKTAVDYWYSNNMTQFTKYLEDTVWCNDREISHWELSSWNPNSGYSESNRLHFSKADMSLSCPNINDRFTVSRENGNGALTYPVGLITSTERQLAYVENKSYLGVGIWYRTMSPYSFASDSGVNTDGGGSAGPVNGTYQGGGVRPMVSLRPQIEFSNGDGSLNTPYIISTS